MKTTKTTKGFALLLSLFLLVSLFIPSVMAEGTEEHTREGYEVVWSEGFEGGQLPAGWQNLDKDGDGYGWEVISAEGDLIKYKSHHGNGLIKSNSFINYEGSVEPDNWLITSSFQVEEGTLLEFQIIAQDPSVTGDQLGIYLFEGESTEAVQLGTDYIANENYTGYTVDLSAYAGKSVKVAFVHHNSVDRFEINLDCIYVWKPGNTAHTHAPVKVEGLKPTCVTEGWKDYYQCSCGELFEDSAAAKAIVDLEQWKLNEGKLDRLPHTTGEWISDETHHWHQCSECQTVLDKAEHSKGEWETVTLPTETSEGLEKRICTVCGKEETRSIPKKVHAHAPVKVDGKKPTCKEEGWKDYYECTCGQLFEDSGATTLIPDLEVWKKGEGKLDKTDHVPGEWHTDDQYHWFVCEECGEILNKEKHQMGEWNVVKEPTKKEEGLKVRICNDCEHMERKIIPVIEDKPVPPQPEEPEVKDETVITSDDSSLLIWSALALVSVTLGMLMKKKMNVR